MTCTTFLTMLMVKQLEMQSGGSSSSGRGSGGGSGRSSPSSTSVGAGEGAGADAGAGAGKEVHYWDRPDWLDHLPPFISTSGPSQLALDAVATLKALQGLLFSHLDPGNAPAVYTTIIKTHASTYPGRLSLELLCLPSMGRVDEGQRMLLRVYPSALLGYAKAFLPHRGTKRWDELLWKVLALVESRSSADPSDADALVDAHDDPATGGRAMTMVSKPPPLFFFRPLFFQRATLREGSAAGCYPLYVCTPPNRNADMCTCISPPTPPPLPTPRTLPEPFRHWHVSTTDRNQKVQALAEQNHLPRTLPCHIYQPACARGKHLRPRIVCGPAACQRQHGILFALHREGVPWQLCHHHRDSN